MVPPRFAALALFACFVVGAWAAPGDHGPSHKVPESEMGSMVRLSTLPGGDDDIFEVADAASCTRCQEFVTHLRDQMLAKPMWKAQDDVECPVQGYRMCDVIWSAGAADRASLVRDIESGMCPHEVCVAQNECLRSTCDACQTALSGTAEVFATDGPAGAAIWLQREFAMRCGEGSDVQKNPMCVPAHQAALLSELPTWESSKFDETGAAHAMCKALTACGPDSTEFRTCSNYVPELPLLRHVEGCTYSYHFNMTFKITMGTLTAVGDEVPEESESKATLDMLATLSITKHGEDMQGCHVFDLMFAQAAVLDDDGVTTDLRPLLNAHDLFFSQCPNGRIKSLIYEEAETLKILNVKRSILSMLHFKAHAHKRVYTTQDFDVDGTDGLANVQYNVTDNGDSVMVSKKKKAQERTFKDMTRTQTSDVVVNKETGVIDASTTHFKSTSGKLQKADRIPGAGFNGGGLDSMMMKVKSDGVLTFLNEQCRPNRTPSASALLQFPDVQAIINHVASIRGDGSVRPFVALHTEANNGLDGDVGHITDDDLFVDEVTPEQARQTARASQNGAALIMGDNVANIVGAMLSPRNSDDLDEATKMLEEMLKMDRTGHVVHEIGRLLHAPVAGKDAFVIKALEQPQALPLRTVLTRLAVRARHQGGAAQAVINDVLLHARTDPLERYMTLHTRLTLARPTRQTIDLLQTLVVSDDASDEARAYAMDALSAIASRFPAHHGLVKETARFAHGMLRSAHDRGAIKSIGIALVSLGNLGGRDHYAAIEPMLTHHSELIRSRAAIAMRKIPGHDVADRLIRAFVSEANPSVRLSILQALQARDEPRATWHRFAAELERSAEWAPPMEPALGEALQSEMRQNGVAVDILPAAARVREDADVQLLVETLNGLMDVDEEARLADLNELGVEVGGDMWGSVSCNSVTKDVVTKSIQSDIDGSANLDFGAKQFGIGVQASFVAKTRASHKQNEWCGTTAASAGTYINLLGKKFTIFGIKLDGSLNKEAQKARPAIIIAGFELSSPMFDVDVDVVALQPTTSVLCEGVRPLPVYPSATPQSFKGDKIIARDLAKAYRGLPGHMKAFGQWAGKQGEMGIKAGQLLGKLTKFAKGGLTPTVMTDYLKMLKSSKAGRRMKLFKSKWGSKLASMPGKKLGIGLFKLMMNTENKFEWSSEVRFWAVILVSIAGGIWMDISLVLEPCMLTGHGIFTLGAMHGTRVNVYVTGGPDVLVAGVGVQMNVEVFSLEILANGNVDVMGAKEPACTANNNAPSYGSKMVQFNWQALSGKVFAFVNILGVWKEMAGICWPGQKGKPSATTRFLDFAAGDDGWPSTQLEIQDSGWRETYEAAKAKASNAVSTASEWAGDKAAAVANTADNVYQKGKQMAAATVKAVKDAYGFTKEQLQKALGSIKQLVANCKSAGFVYNGVKVVYGRCMCGGRVVSCPSVPAANQRYLRAPKMQNEAWDADGVLATWIAGYFLEKLPDKLEVEIEPTPPKTAATGSNTVASSKAATTKKGPIVGASLSPAPESSAQSSAQSSAASSAASPSSSSFSAASSPSSSSSSVNGQAQGVRARVAAVDARESQRQRAASARLDSTLGVYYPRDRMAMTTRTMTTRTWTSSSSQASKAASKAFAQAWDAYHGHGGEQAPVSSGRDEPDGDEVQAQGERTRDVTREDGEITREHARRDEQETRRALSRSLDRLLAQALAAEQAEQAAHGTSEDGDTTEAHADGSADDVDDVDNADDADDADGGDSEGVAEVVDSDVDADLDEALAHADDDADDDADDRPARGPDDVLTRIPELDADAFFNPY